MDHLDLGVEVSGFASSVQGFVNPAGTLEQALASIASHVAVGSATAFTLGGHTYVFVQNFSSALEVQDGLIRLVGVTGVSTATGAASGDLHYG